ncbi:MAG TPA: flagellar protein export ATPase FliI [Limnobacter sp.]|uniref:flagellar protein export ATPase FliI n=1 Tax=Limnobacter sp. TaxID=2003368 RepID=UPI002E370744|nr:flagellar protein export ATPase FliI [Limnobacter sp.]HEX5485150.1 flagellar protein export ATPase FliI [Limnobacter sp.]
MSTDLLNWLDDCQALVKFAQPVAQTGKLVRVAGLVMEAVGLKLPVGSVCTVVQKGTPDLEAEVVGFSGERLFLMPSTDVHGMTPGARVIPQEPPAQAPKLGQKAHPWRRPEDKTKHLPVGDSLLGRVVDSNGKPLDNLGELKFEKRCPLAARPINPLEREPIHEPLDVGVKAINALLTVGRGQRIGLMAGSGVGKSVLLGMMARYTKADRVVVGLIGERGREVKEFIEQILGEEGLKRSVVIAAPADVSPLLRMQGAAYTQVVAEHFRDQGHNVLMIMDSLTRYAMAQREIALAIGEPPATKGYPPSVFAKLPALVERAGNGRPGGGSITAFYTVLTEGDDQQDPIADAARAILDGHIVLSRSLAESGHYPAIDIEQSISRAMHNIVSAQHLNAARHLKASFSKVQRNRDLITVGAYAAGADPQLDHALALYPQIEKLLQQSMLESAHFEEAMDGLKALFPDDFNGSTKH